MTRTYVITGSASGIGAATTELLRSQGHTVIGVDLAGAEVDGDLSSRAGREAAAEATIRAAGDGGIDAVIACAGISAPSAKTMAINYFGVVEFLTALLPVLGRAEAPRAAVVSSMASLHPVSADLVDAALSGDEARALEIGGQLAATPEAGYLNYSSSKRALSRWVRRESVSAAWAGAGIPLNAVAPGTVVTAMTADLLSTPEGTAQVDTAVPMPLNYHQPASSIAELLVWLTSPVNTHMAGQTIYCDGGADAVLRGDDIWSWNDAPQH